MILLTSQAGLCNRLRALGSAILLSRATGHKLRAWWEVNEFCAATYTDLFEPIPDVETQALTAQWMNRIFFSERPFLRRAKLATSFASWGTTLQGKLDPYFYPNHAPLSQAAVDNIARRRLVCIRSDDGWFYPEDFSWLVPKRSTQQTIDATVSALPLGSVGVHIRRGDHASAIATNPTRSFVDAISFRLQIRPETRFYVATDDVVLRAQLAGKFGDCVVVHEADSSRDTVAGLQSAVVDLFCLAKCSEIWGTLGSSLSETAHHISGAPLSFPAKMPP